MNHGPYDKTVDLAELTTRFELPPDKQETVASFANGAGPWTETEAAELVEVWEHEVPTDQF